MLGYLDDDKLEGWETVGLRVVVAEVNAKEYAYKGTYDPAGLLRLLKRRFRVRRSVQRKLFPMALDLKKIVAAKNFWREATRGLTSAEKKDFAEWLDSLKGADAPSEKGGSS